MSDGEVMLVLMPGEKVYMCLSQSCSRIVYPDNYKYI